MFSVYAIKILSIFSLPRLYLLADYILYPIIRHVLQYRRKVVKNNIAIAFPQYSEKEKNSIEKGFYHYFCSFLVEVIYLKNMSQNELSRRIVWKNKELISKHIDSAQTILCYMGHYAQWEWFCAAIGTVIPNATYIYKPLHNESLNELLKQLREKGGATGIDIEHVSEWLREKANDSNEEKGNLLIALADQLPREQYVRHFSRFMGVKTKVITGTEKLINQYNLVPCFIRMTQIKRGYYECEFVAMDEHIKQESHSKYPITDTYFKLLQQQITSKPAFYLWSHDRWKR